MTGSSRTLDLPLGPPPTVNQVYGTLNRYQRATAVRTWREAAAWTAKADRWPVLGPVEVTAFPVVKSHRSTADVGACMPAAKAAIDGLVDAGVLPGDGPRWVVRLTFVPAVLLGWAGIRLLVVEVVDGPPPGG